MKLKNLSGGRLPSSLRIERKEIAFLVDANTGIVLPAILSNDEETGTPDNRDIQAYLQTLGYQSDPEGRFDLPKEEARTLPCPSVN